MGFDEVQKAALRRDLPRDMVMTKPGSTGAAYLPGWYVIDHANRVFGHDGWSFRVLEIREVFSGRKGPAEGANVLGAYEALVEVTVQGVVRQDVGLDSFDDPPHAVLAGIDKARKGCVTDGLKRCFRTFGMGFGLALYDKKRRAVGFSTRCLALLDAVETIATEAAAVAWWRANTSTVDALDEDEYAAVREAFSLRRRSFVAVAPSPESVAVAAPVAPVIAPIVVDSARPPASSAKGGRTVDLIVEALRAADSIERLRSVPKLFEDVHQTAEQRVFLTDLYRDQMLVLDPEREILSRARLANDDERKDSVYSLASSLLSLGLITQATFDRAASALTARRSQ